MDGVVRIPAVSNDANQASRLNDALWHIFPSKSVIPPTAVVAVFEDDQARTQQCHAAVLDNSYHPDLLHFTKAVQLPQCQHVVAGARCVVPDEIAAISTERWCALGAFTSQFWKYWFCIRPS